MLLLQRARSDITGSMTPSINRSAIVLLAAPLFFFCPARTQATVNESGMRLDDMVVTGTRTPKSLKEGPVKTEVIPANEIQQRRLRNAAEAILEVPGVTLMDATGKSGQSAVMQGLGGEHVLVLVDGAPILQNSSAGVDLTQISANDIERIEVVKGGASALYGGQAMGGVINILTKKPQEGLSYEFDLMKEFSQVDPALATGKRRVSPNSPNQLNALIRGRRDDHAYKVSLSRSEQASFDRDSKSVTRDTPDLEKNQIGLWYERTQSQKHKINLELGYADEKAATYFARLQPNSSFAAVENLGTIERLRAKLGYHSNLNATTTLAMYFLGERVNDVLNMEDNPATSVAEALKKSKLDRQRVEAQLDFSAGDQHVISVGAVGELNSLDQSTTTAINANVSYDSVEVAGRSQSTTEIFVQDDWLLPGQEIISGLRFSHDPAFGVHLDPKVNWLYSADWFAGHTSAVRASIGSGFRRPNLKERYYLLDHRSFAGYIVYGNENLRPEESVSAQLGVEIARGEDYAVNGNVFYNRVNGLITTNEVATGTSERAFRFENLDRVQIQGLELSGVLKFATAWRINPSFTYTRARDEGTGLFVANRPFYLGQMNLVYELSGDRGNVNATLRYQGDSYANTENTERYAGYSAVDLRFNRQLSKEFEIYLGIRNLLDARKEALIDGTTQVYDLRPALGRTLFVGMNFEG